jgi:hypothetical protein
MKKCCKIFLFSFLICLLHQFANGQAYVTRSIKSFGAKGDGKTNDTKAFEDASAFFNKRGGNGKLTIPAGTYMVGKNINPTGANDYKPFMGINILAFTKCKNLTIEGQKKSTIKYISGLKFGSFEPMTGKVFNDNSRTAPDRTFARAIGNCIALMNCTGITINNVLLNGNNKEIEFGGVYGDIGIQLLHTGIYINDSRVIRISNCNASYFGLDGIQIGNAQSGLSDSIFITNSNFDYNSRQGLSWVGGNFLQVKNCSFSHTGQNGKHSPPGCGLDIEAENGPVRNGRFYNCSFIDNIGCGMGADSGNSGDCSFTGCTFWGTDYFAIVVKKPSFLFSDCKIYGTVVAGYDAVVPSEGTRFTRCYFEDKPYKGIYKPSSSYIFDSDGARSVSIDSCTFVANTTRFAWLTTAIEASAQQKKSVSNTHFILKHADLVATDVVLLLRGGVKFKNNVVEFTDPAAKGKRYWPNGCCTGTDVNDLGGNKVIYH